MRNWHIRAHSDGRPLLRRLFELRGLPGRFEDYINLPLTGLESPGLLSDIEKAAARIKLALVCREAITVYGDFDVDGITSVAILMRWLRAHNACCDWYIPERKGEGYGLHAEAVEVLHARGTRVILTVDTGITGFDAVAQATALGMDVIVTDHHNVRDNWPEACAVVNPKKPDYRGDAELAGVGVVFQLLRVLEGLDNDAQTIELYGAPAALGTVADIMAMTPHNRTLVRHGLNALRNGHYKGLEALANESGVGKRLNSTALGYGLAPRLNAAGRMGQTKLAVDLLLTDDADEAEALAKALCDLNRTRQQVEGELQELAFEQAEQQQEQPVLVLTGEDWHPGVIGIVASRLLDKTGKPVFMISVENGKGKGSSRAPKGFHLVEALAANAPLLSNYGGHAAAAGFVVDAADIPALREGLCAYAAAAPEGSGDDALDIDLALTQQELTLANARELTRAEPFGVGNLPPLFCVCGLQMTAMQEIGGGKHTRFCFSDGSMTVNGVWFGMPAAELPYEPDMTVDVAFSLEINEFRGNEVVQLVVADLRPDCHDRAYAALKNGDALTPEQRQALAVTRSEIGRVWRAAVAVPAEGYPWHKLRALTAPSGDAHIRLSLDILQQMGLLAWHEARGMVYVRAESGITGDLLHSEYWRMLSKEVSS